MKKVLLLSITVALIGAFFCGCSQLQMKSSVSSDTTSATQSENVSTTSEATLTEADKTTTALPSSDNATSTEKADIMSCEVELNGKKLSIPCEYKQLADLGFEIKKDEDLKRNTYTIGTYVKNKDGVSLSVQFWNSSKETKKYSECQIGQIEFDADDKCDYQLPGGFEFNENTKKEDVIAAYGEPDDTVNSKDSVTLIYGSAYKSVKFNIYTEPTMKKYSRVVINNMEG